MALPNGVDFYVNGNRILEPLDLAVLRDSRVDLFPRIKERTEEIPGRHGEINFGSKLEPRILELHVVVNEEFPFAEREKKKRQIAGYLNPTMGTKALVFADEPDKQYFVKYAGVIDIDRQYTSWFEFTIPFKCSDPYIYSTAEEKAWGNQQAAVGMGDAYNPDHAAAINLYNKGNTPIPVIASVTGISNSPTITIGDKTMRWNELVGAGHLLVIDTGRLTVTYNDDNSLQHFNNVFIKLQPGDNIITVTGGGTFEFSWVEKWV